jgi:uncharacterized protein GlcG (DUF336 family)
MNSTICLQDALRAIDAALAYAESAGAAVCVTVVDSGGNVLALARMDGASFLTATLAENKAMTAAGLGMATGDLAEFVGQNPLLLAAMTTQPPVTVLPGGVPVPGGAVGVAGGNSGEDHPIAEAAAAALAAAPVGA